MKISATICWEREYATETMIKFKKNIARLRSKKAKKHYITQNKDDRKLLSACPINYKLIHSNLIKLFPKLYKQYF